MIPEDLSKHPDGYPTDEHPLKGIIPEPYLTRLRNNNWKQVPNEWFKIYDEWRQKEIAKEEAELKRKQKEWIAAGCPPLPKEDNK